MLKWMCLLCASALLVLLGVAVFRPAAGEWEVTPVGSMAILVNTRTGDTYRSYGGLVPWERIPRKAVDPEGSAHGRRTPALSEADINSRYATATEANATPVPVVPGMSDAEIDALFEKLASETNPPPASVTPAADDP